MKTIEERRCEKSAWGPGPWQDEPDKIQWLDEATGLPCLANRNDRIGHWCGYVGVPPGHPLYEVSYHIHETDFEVHGCLTFSGHCDGHICHEVEPGEEDSIWWLGFDCGHAGDRSPGGLDHLDPGLQFFVALAGDSADEYGGTYKTLEYVKAECRKLATQLAAMQKVT